MLDPKELCARITDYLSLGGLFNPELMDPQKVSDLLIDCRAYLSALPQEPPSASMGVVVKALEWSEDRDDDGTEIHRAHREPVNLPYTVYEDGFIKKPFGLSLNQLRIASFDSVEAAKAAAQADFDQRVRSCLSPAPSPSPAPGVVEQLKRLVDAWDDPDRRCVMLPYLGANTCGDVADLVSAALASLSQPAKSEREGGE